jgi:hypothetical protein
MSTLRNILLIIFSYLPGYLFSQGEFNNWYFGMPSPGTGITFNSGSPVTIPNGVMWSAISTVSVSDSTGNLLFFSDGFTVYNKNKNVMQNGTGLLGSYNEFTQPVIATPKLDDDSSYYIFTVDQFNPIDPYYGFVYSIINMRLDGGLGAIEPAFKNIPVPGMNTAWFAVTGTRHKNNKFAWIITTVSSTSKIQYAAFLIDNSGLSATPVLSPSLSYSSYPPPFYYKTPPHSIRVSPDGSKMVSNYGGINEFCTFNSQTGNVTRLSPSIRQ